MTLANRPGKAFRTSAKPGHTRKLTGTVRIHDDPLIYVYDAPGVMVPFLGRGDEGVEKGLKLALMCAFRQFYAAYPRFRRLSG